MTAFNVRVSEDILQQLSDIVKHADMSRAEFLKHIVHLYEQGGMGVFGLEGQTIKSSSLNPEQNEILEKAIAITGGTIEDFMIDASLARAKQVTSLSGYTSEELKKVPNSANIKIHRAVMELIERNKAAKEWYEKIEVTQGKIFEATGSNRAAIRKYFSENETLINDHNKALNLEPNHNTKAAVYLLQMAKQAAKGDKDNG